MKMFAVAFGLLNLSLMLTSCAATGPTARNAGAVGSVFRDCADCPEMVIVPAGRFVMGTAESDPIRDKDEGPQREVTFASAFAVSKFEVTRGQFRQFVSETGYEALRNCTVTGGTSPASGGRTSEAPFPFTSTLALPIAPALSLARRRPWGAPLPLR